jgi:demethylmenaquinone methyltransferase/2-methoxy-6-polyprenyl-1,4-benzoquinol methylase
MDYGKNRHAQRLFDGIASRYDLLSELLSFFQAGLWRRYLISRLKARPGDTVLDLCTGTAGVAVQLAAVFSVRVVGVDLSPMMLRRAQHRISQGVFDGDIGLLLGRAEDLAFADEGFDAVCFTYLLRYVDDPEAILRELVRVLKPGGSLVSLEFGVPPNIVVRGLWYAYTRVALPLTVRAISPGWRRVGTFLGPSISEFYRAHPIDQIQRMWVKAGISDVQTKRLSLGGGVVMWGTKAHRAKTPDLGSCRMDTITRGGSR